MFVMTLSQLAKKFAKEYAVVSLKFVKSQLEHPDHPHANKNAEALLKEAGFVKGGQVRLVDETNACGYTTATCYWCEDYFNNKAPTYQVMKKLANQKLVPEPVADQPEEHDCGGDTQLANCRELDSDALSESQTCEASDERTVALEEPAFEAAALIPAFVYLRREVVKTYLKALPPSHQRAFCLLYEAVFQDLDGICTLYSQREEDGSYTKHQFEACPLSEDARRFYNPLINMFYHNGESWHGIVVDLELHGKPDLTQGWKSLLKPPYSETLLSTYYFLTNLNALLEDTLKKLTGLN
ncbi:hypothetical protein [Escherichia coli]|uniref:hypothetical protein n=1 Tax=Escherichia coli TaxID=562 RepID=UPI000BB995E2|nr:hypothetical protein [Escherichia coli]